MSLPRYAEYKDSGAPWMGDVPASWETRRVKHVFEIKKRIAGEEGYDILSITQKGIKVKDIESNDGQLSMDYGKYQFVEVGDFAMNHMDLLTGYVDISPFFGVTSPDYRVFSVKDSNLCDAKYFLYLFQNGYRQRIFYAFGQGASQLGRWRFPTEQFNDFILPLPSLDEQTAIATFLDRETAKIDGLIAEQEKLIALLAEKRQATISHAVTKGLNPAAPMKDSGVAWLGEVPAHWAIHPLKRALHFLTSGSRGWAEHYSDNGALFLRIGNLSRGGIELDLTDIQRVAVPEGAEGARTKVQPDDVLFSITAYLGSVAVVPAEIETAYVSQHIALARIDTDKLHPCWCAYVTLSRIGKIYLETQGYGGTKIQLSLEDVANLVLTVPPPSEQLAIIEFIGNETTKLNALKAESERGIALLKERRSALISAAVTGKIDVRHLAEAEAA